MIPISHGRLLMRALQENYEGSVSFCEIEDEEF